MVEVSERWALEKRAAGFVGLAVLVLMPGYQRFSLL